jgi:predicted Rossmann fold nucleotide-binding protein DprA/Smf involved in DNA uptake
LRCADRAGLAESAADVCSAIDGYPRRPIAMVPEAQSPAGRVLAALGGDPKGSEELSLATGLAVRDVTRVLVGLELEGLAVPMSGHSYIRSILASEALGG